MNRAEYDAVYLDIEEQLFPHGLPKWITEDGRQRAHARIDSIVQKIIREGRSGSRWQSAGRSGPILTRSE